MYNVSCAKAEYLRGVEEFISCALEHQKKLIERTWRQWRKIRFPSLWAATWVLVISGPYLHNNEDPLLFLWFFFFSVSVLVQGLMHKCYKLSFNVMKICLFDFFGCHMEVFVCNVIECIRHRLLYKIWEKILFKEEK